MAISVNLVKTYLLMYVYIHIHTRMLHYFRWSGNVRYAQFARLRYSVRTKLLHAVPPFGGALLQAAKLCKEVVALEFLPVDVK